MTPAKTLSNIGEEDYLDLPCSQTDEYLKYHHRNFIQQLMETEAETPSEHWTKLPKSS